MQPEPEATDPLFMPEAVTPQPPPTTKTAKSQIPWIPLAAASGACAAFNGVFAKLYVFTLTLPFL